MKARLQALPQPEGPGRIAVDLKGKGLHHFRLPTWSQSARIANAWGERPEGDGMWEYVALIVGAAWNHESQELEAPFPDDDPTKANLVRYSVAVQHELEDAGYTAHDVRRLGAVLLDALRERMKEPEEAAKLADFSAPPADAGSST